MTLDPSDQKRSESMKLRQVPKEKIKKSREKREDWYTEFGFRPTSIWDIGHKANWKHSRILQKLMSDTVASNTYMTGDISNGLILVPDEQPTSQFPLELARRIVKFWSDKGDKVFDPFSGMGERMQVTAYLGRDYYGYDISKKFQTQKQVMIDKQLLAPFKGKRILYLHDSRKIDFPDNYFDMSFTSPPYYDVEVKAYGDEPEQLGLVPTYEAFLEEYEKIIKETIRVVKPEKYIIFVVGDFRKDKRLIPFHADTIEIFERNGCVYHDCIIYEVGTLTAAFLQPIKEYKRMGKTHEYVLVFKKLIVEAEDSNISCD